MGGRERRLCLTEMRTAVVSGVSQGHAKGSGSCAASVWLQDARKHKGSGEEANVEDCAAELLTLGSSPHGVMYFF